MKKIESGDLMVEDPREKREKQMLQARKLLNKRKAKPKPRLGAAAKPPPKAGTRMPKAALATAAPSAKGAPPTTVPKGLSTTDLSEMGDYEYSVAPAKCGIGNSLVMASWVACAVLLLGVVLNPMRMLSAETAENRELLPDIIGVKYATTTLEHHLAPFHVSSSYGGVLPVPGGPGAAGELMGVGPRQMDGVPEEWGWGGLPPSIVRVPVVVLEGQPSEDPFDWREIPMRYMRLGEKTAPRRTAPHQPRLDWQMSRIAAEARLKLHRFGRMMSDADGGIFPEDADWLKTLALQITDPSMGSAAVDLLDPDAYPFKDKPPVRVRASLYHYDFTRVESPWAARIPGATVLPRECLTYRYEESEARSFEADLDVMNLKPGWWYFPRWPMWGSEESSPTSRDINRDDFNPFPPGALQDKQKQMQPDVDAIASAFATAPRAPPPPPSPPPPPPRERSSFSRKSLMLSCNSSCFSGYILRMYPWQPFVSSPWKFTSVPRSSFNRHLKL